MSAIVNVVLKGLLLEDCALVRSPAHSESVVHQIICLGAYELVYCLPTDWLGARLSNVVFGGAWSCGRFPTT